MDLENNVPCILIVDDSTSVTFMLSQILMFENYRTIIANEGYEALKKLKEEKIDLILLDIMMPEMDGFEVCQILKKEPLLKNIPVIFLTAKDDSNSVVKGFEIGAVDYMIKPFQNIELLARVKTHLELKFAREKLIDQINELEKTKIIIQEERESLAKRVAEKTIELRSANRELTKASQHKDEFFANMSHEFKTPLNTIINLSQSLQETTNEILNEKQTKYLKHIEESGLTILSLINDILDIARIGAGKMKLEYTNISISPFIGGCLRSVSQLSESKNIAIKTKVENNLNIFYADEKRMKQVIVNLLTNAIKFTQESKEIGIEIKSNNKHIVFTVWDTGIGISDEDIKKLFKPFTQLNSKLTRQSGGTGLGLSLVSNLVKLHKGKIDIESQVNMGSRFIVTIPLNI